MYTDDKNAQTVIGLLKQYGIKKIVISPGTANVPVSRSVQIDPWFEVYSVVDERSAAYFATGLAYESGESVAISCTGATASRNYLSGLTEAYYRKLPVIALTSQHHVSDFNNLVPQVTDRTVSQNDIKNISVQLPVVKDDEDLERCVISVNKALISATTRGKGPVHINLLVDKLSFTTSKLPKVRKIEYHYYEELAYLSKQFAKELTSKKIAVFIGAHRKFNEKSEKILEDFAIRYDAAIIVDQTSGYKGKNAILLTQLTAVVRSSNRPDLVIDLGSVTGDYNVSWLRGIETWRISEDGQIHDRLHNQTKLFDCSEESFFSSLVSGGQVNNVDYHKLLAEEVKDLIVPEMPLSNTSISYELSKQLPKNSNLHLGILNSLRNMNFYKLDKTINTTSNVGGFGIDGALSTLIGQSMADKNKLTFGLVGDLAAFYDMNALGIRHIGKNIRILLVNNNGGVEFRLNPTIEDQWAEDTNQFISAQGHNGSMKAWAEAMNFHYMYARDKNQLQGQIAEFCDPSLNKFDKPVLFEVFTTIEDEQTGLRIMHTSNPPKQVSDQESKVNENTPTKKKLSKKIKGRLKSIAPESAKKAYREFRKDG